MNELQHPEELLAEYVDGALGPEDRALVEAHLLACAACREDVSLAGGARDALGSLPELDVPAGATWPVVERARRRRTLLPGIPWNPRVAWATAGAAAVAAAVVWGFVATRTPSGDQAAAPAPAAEERAEAPGVAADRAGADYPLYRTSDQDYEPASLRELAVDLAAEAQVALDQGFQEPPAAFYANGRALSRLTPQATTSLSCVTEAVAPGRALVPFVVEAARFEGELAYVAAFLQAEAPDRAYTELTIYVVSREECALRSFASQRL